MLIIVYKNDNGKLMDNIVVLGLENIIGWWNCIQLVDLDNDGDQDFVVGNVGFNIKFSVFEDKLFKVYVNDFDNNGINDVYLVYYDYFGCELLVCGCQCFFEQMDFVFDEFFIYYDFVQVLVKEILDGRMEGVIELVVKDFLSMILCNDGQGSFM